MSAASAPAIATSRRRAQPPAGPLPFAGREVAGLPLPEHADVAPLRGDAGSGGEHVGQVVRPDGSLHRLEAAVHRVREKILLVREVPVEGGPGDTDGGGDLLLPDVVEAPQAEEVGRGAHDEGLPVGRPPVRPARPRRRGRLCHGDMVSRGRSAAASGAGGALTLG
jgi:hypothetical protein